MESYVEVSFLYNWLTILVSVLLASYSCIQPINVKKGMLYAFMISLVGVSLYEAGSLYVAVLLESLFFMMVFPHKRKLYIYAMALRWFSFYSCFALYGGSFHNGLYFVPIRVNPLPIWLLYGGLLFMLKQKWKDLFAKGNYVYAMTLYLEEQQLPLKAYLDSGNLLCHEQQPVIFLDEKYQTYFQDSSIELVVMNTVEKTGVLSCHSCVIQVDGCKRHRVYVSCERHLTLPFDCEVLLNMKLMTLG